MYCLDYRRAHPHLSFRDETKRKKCSCAGPFGPGELKLNNSGTVCISILVDNVHSICIYIYYMRVSRWLLLYIYIHIVHIWWNCFLQLTLHEEMLLRPDVNITRRSYTKPQSLNAVPTTAFRWAPMIITGVGIYIYIIYYIQTYLFFSLSLYISLWNSKLRQVRMPSDTIPPTNKFTLLLGVVRQLPCKEWPIRRLEFWRCSIIFPYFPYFSD